MSEGYGCDWTVWDALVRERFKEALDKLGVYKYRNFEVFKSPQGRWMAFHGSSYMDIRVVDLETCEVVCTNFYSNRVLNSAGEYDREKSFYIEHTNVSTCVPTYLKSVYDDYSVLCEPTDLESEGDKEDFTQWDKMISLPFAFNAFTYWAADWELYVDVLDLREIDKGIIKKWEGATSFVIPHGADHVRNYVKLDDAGIIKPKDGNKEFTHADFKVLEERTRDRFHVNNDGTDFKFYNMYKKGDEGLYKVEEDLPWQVGQRMMEEQRKKRAEKDKSNG